MLQQRWIITNRRNCTTCWRSPPLTSGSPQCSSLHQCQWIYHASHQHVITDALFHRDFHDSHTSQWTSMACFVRVNLTQPHSMLLSCLHDMLRHPLPTLIISCTNRNRKKSHSRISSRRLHCFFATKVLCSICSCIIYTLPPALSDLPVFPFWSAQRPLSRRWMLLGGRRTAGH